MNSDFYNTYFEVEKSHWWFKVRRNIIFSILSKYKIEKDKKILDYGCGSGFFVGQLQKKSFNAYGMDISKKAIECGIGRGVKNLFQENEMKVNFPDSYFNVILAMDVIEHIEDDKSAIRELRKLLKSDGYLIITVPAYQWMWGIQDEATHHYRRYTTNSISGLVKNFPDLRILKKTYFNTFLFLPVALVRLMSKWLNIKNRESDFDINNKFINAIFYSIFNLESQFIRFTNFPFGVSILLVLKKK